ncbi:MAG: biotin attachment protein [Deltaproteobacteria bacterium]|jgi:biotin carboxyl carrier protein|nr:biotin attachment protein [Deltaproteobacteria bacterium]
MLNITELLEQLKASPYEEIHITAPHTGHVAFAKIQPGDTVYGPRGAWKEKPGTQLASLEREHNPKAICAPQKGVISNVRRELDGSFVEAGTRLATMKHTLTREEVLSRLLRQALHLFNAPERAKYYFSPDMDKKIRAGGVRSVTVHDGMEVFIMSRMKREVPLAYSGPGGLIYTVYFKHTDNVDAGQPLIGVCPPDQLDAIEHVVMRVQAEWKEE